MKWLLVILSICLASCANAQTYITNACVILVTNAANTDSSWVNVGSDPGTFTQGNAGTIPTNKGTYYECYNGRAVTGNVAATTETNSIILSCWVRFPDGTGGANGAQCFENWEGNSGPAMFSTVIAGTWYVGVRKSGGIYYFSASLSDTASFHHQLYSYNRANTHEVIAYLDGVRLTSSAGTPVTLDQNTYPYTLGAYSSGTNIYSVQDKVYASHAMIFTNYAGSVDLLASNIYANGRNYYAPPAPPASGDPSMNREAAGLYLRAFQ